MARTFLEEAGKLLCRRYTIKIGDINTYYKIRILICILTSDTWKALSSSQYLLLLKSLNSNCKEVS